MVVIRLAGVNMPFESKRISTAADELVDLVTREKEISFGKASKILKIPARTIEDWANFLEEDGVIGIKYKMTTPYLTVFDPKTANAKKKKKDKVVFDEHLADAEIKSNIDVVSEFLGEIADRSSKGEFAELDQDYDNVNSRLKTLLSHILEKGQISPQQKAKMSAELTEIEQKAAAASEMVKTSRFDSANIAYESLNEKANKLLEKVAYHNSFIQDISNPSMAAITELLENTYGLMREGQMERSQDNYDKLKLMFTGYSNRFLSERSGIQQKILKLNQDIVVNTQKFGIYHMKTAKVKIKSLAKSASKSLGKKDYEAASTYYAQIKKIFDSLPKGFSKEKQALEAMTIRIFDQITKYKEKRLEMRFLQVSGRINELLKQANQYIETGDIKKAFIAYGDLNKSYQHLPPGFMKNKFDLQDRIVEVQKNLFHHMESQAENSTVAKTQEIMSLLATMNAQTLQGQLKDAENNYSQINKVFSELPEGFIKRKTELQGKIVDAYEKLLKKKGHKFKEFFRGSVDNINRMIDETYQYAKNGQYEKANASYKLIKAAYVELMSMKPQRRDDLRNRILALYKQIFTHSPQEAVMHKPVILPKVELVTPKSTDDQIVKQSIDDLKARSRAQVKMPA